MELYYYPTVSRIIFVVIPFTERLVSLVLTERLTISILSRAPSLPPHHSSTQKRARIELVPGTSREVGFAVYFRDSISNRVFRRLGLPHPRVEPTPWSTERTSSSCHVAKALSSRLVVRLTKIRFSVGAKRYRSSRTPICNCRYFDWFTAVIHPSRSSVFLYRSLFVF